MRFFRREVPAEKIGIVLTQQESYSTAELIIRGILLELDAPWCSCCC